MEREDKRGVFFGVIGVLTLIVAIIVLSSQKMMSKKYVK